MEEKAFQLQFLLHICVARQCNHIAIHTVHYNLNTNELVSVREQFWVYQVNCEPVYCEEGVHQMYVNCSIHGRLDGWGKVIQRSDVFHVSLQMTLMHSRWPWCTAYDLDDQQMTLMSWCTADDLDALMQRQKWSSLVKDVHHWSTAAPEDQAMFIFPFWDTREKHTHSFDHFTTVIQAVSQSPISPKSNRFLTELEPDPVSAGSIWLCLVAWQLFGSTVSYFQSSITEGHQLPLV